MLATLPKLADKAFIIGFLLPVFLFLLCGFALFSDAKVVSDLLDNFFQKDALEKFAYLALFVWGLAILMMMLNRMQYQMLEGYLWPLSKMKVLKTRQLAKFDRLTKRVETLAEEWKSLPIQKRREHDSLLIKLNQAFPAERELVLPTRFGNAIRAFETYAKKVYGADGTALWLHLATVVSKGFQAALEDARAQVNCLVNLCLFAVVIGLMAAVRLVQSSDSVKRLSFGLVLIGAIVVVRVTYELSIERIYSWGELVKAAFDCYLPALARRLGYRLPTTGVKQKDFWTAVSRRAIYHRQLNPEEWPRANGDEDDEQNNDGDQDKDGDGDKSISD